MGTKQALVALQEKKFGDMRNEEISDGRRVEAIAKRKAVFLINSLNEGGEDHPSKTCTMSDIFHEGYKRREGGRLLNTPLIYRLTIGC